ncbi:S41 family peptidase [Subsaximicrobium wynnwilliamsii]|nr:S41 family peptidase [Subsaximicrobium wynnwilliamsii]
MNILSLTAQDCNCEDSFAKTVETYESNYSLFMYKVTDENRNLYRAHTDIMRTKASQTETVQDCRAVLGQWLDFFRDGHTRIGISAKSRINSEKIAISEELFKSEYKGKKYEQNPLLGIWQNGGYSVAVIPNPKGSDKKRDFVGVTLESSSEDWDKNDVKFELTTNFGSSYDANFMMRDHSPEPTKAQLLSKRKLSFEGLRVWTKIWPEADVEALDSEVIRKFGEFHYTELDGIPYLRFPDFYSVGEAHVDSIMKVNHEKLIAADFIIVDVRDNGGGNDDTYYPILPYILSGPVQVPNSGLWMSNDNIRQFLDNSDLKGKSVEDYSEEERQMYDYVMSLKGTAFFQEQDYANTYEPDTLYAGPKKVILLAGDAGSSGETFVYRANQSDKVVVYGQNTAGVVDGFNGLSKDIGCFKLTYPSSFRARDVDKNPIDPYGIAPDVYVDEKVDVLTYAIEHMKQLIKDSD